MTLVAGEGDPAQQRSELRRVAATPPPTATPPDPDDMIECSAAELAEMRKLTNDHMTPEEKELTSFSRKQLMKLSDWPTWKESVFKQSDAHCDAGAIGHPVPRPTSTAEAPSQVFRLVWAFLVKANGTRKARACPDGSRRAAPWSRTLVQTHSSCVESPCLRAFIAECVNRGHCIGFGDVDNACQQSPPPTVDCHLEVDDSPFDWCLHRFGEKVDRKNFVFPLCRALQGHPEAGVLWERMITDVPINKMGFKNTAHEKNLHSGTVDGKNVLVCRQVDDFASGAADRSTVESFMTQLRSFVSAECTALGLETPEGMFERCNGLNILQTRDCVMLGCESHIDRMLQTHGWDNPKSKDPINPVPINKDNTNHLMTLEGPVEKSAEAKELARSNGFACRNVLGELIHACVICRVDIGFAVCFLARFSERPHQEHFNAPRGVCKCLRATKSWGLMFQRPSPIDDLPHVDFDFLEEDPNPPPFPTPLRNRIDACLDAAHASDLKTRRSVTGLVVFFGCVAMAWKSRLQAICATSSAEAEFHAAVVTAKIVKCPRCVLSELDAMTEGPSNLCIDNLAALAMINESRPAPRARHVETQHFAIQEWCKAGDIRMVHCPGTINASDDMTKALAWILHSRHCRRNMGHCKLGSSSEASESPVRSTLEQGPSKPGRVLEPEWNVPATEHVTEVSPG